MFANQSNIASHADSLIVCSFSLNPLESKAKFIFRFEKTPRGKIIQKNRAWDREFFEAEFSAGNIALCVAERDNDLFVQKD